MYIGNKYILNGKTWRVASAHYGDRAHPWAWLVNVKKPMEQARMSLKALDESVLV